MTTMSHAPPEPPPLTPPYTNYYPFAELSAITSGSSPMHHAMGWGESYAQRHGWDMHTAAGKPSPES